MPCYKDERCTSPKVSSPADRIGCNAGDAHPNCRFCGFGEFESIPCPGSALSDKSAALSGDEGEGGVNLIVIALGVSLAVLFVLAFCLVRWCRKMRREHSKAEDKLQKRRVVRRLSLAMSGGNAYPEMNTLTNVVSEGSNTIEWKRLELERLLGVGRLGKCYVATLDKQADKMVLRRLDPQMANLFNGYAGLQAYIDITKVIPSHPHLVELVGLVTDGISNHGLLTPQLPHTLSAMLAKARASTVVASKIRKGWLQVAQGIVDAVCHLHSFDTPHRMLHPNYVLFDAKMTVKLIDYGFPKKVVADALDTENNDKTRQMYSGTTGDLPILYAAPEILLEGPKHLSKPADVWALGCLVARIASTRELYESVSQGGGSTPRDSTSDGLAGLEQALLSDTWREWLDVVLTDVVSGSLNPADDLDKFSSKVPPNAAAFVRSCAVAEPTDRPTIEAVAQLLKAIPKPGQVPATARRASKLERRMSSANPQDNVSPSKLPAPSMQIAAAALPSPGAGVAPVPIPRTSPADAPKVGAPQTEPCGGDDDDDGAPTYLALAADRMRSPTSSTTDSTSANGERDSSTGTKAAATRLPPRGNRAQTLPVTAPSADERDSSAGTKSTATRLPPRGNRAQTLPVAAPAADERDSAIGTKAAPTRLAPRGGDRGASSQAKADDDSPVAVREHSPSMVYLPTRIGGGVSLAEGSERAVYMPLASPPVLDHLEDVQEDGDGALHLTAEDLAEPGDAIAAKSVFLNPPDHGHTSVGGAPPGMGEKSHGLAEKSRGLAEKSRGLAEKSLSNRGLAEKSLSNRGSQSKRKQPDRAAVLSETSATDRLYI